MEPTTLTALKESIIAWEKKLEADNPHQISLGPNACPLCDLFFYSNCEGCPIMVRTREALCMKTPYREADDALADWQYAHGKKEYFQEAAKKEIAFLKSLLPL